MKVVPPDIDQLIDDAIYLFWETRAGGSGRQEGSRSQVVSGKNLDGFLNVVQAVANHCGCGEGSVITSGSLALPGYFRITKRWDALIIVNRRLLAVLEFKSIADSFGNNCNNRIEEAIGNGFDLQTAVQDGLFNHPKPPFLGYLMVMEDCEKTRKPIKSSSPHFPIKPEFEGSSYAKRIQLLCELLMYKRVYSSAGLILTQRNSTRRNASLATSASQFFADLGGFLAANVDAFE